MCQVAVIKYHPALCTKCGPNREPVLAGSVGIIHESHGVGV